MARLLLQTSESSSTAAVRYCPVHRNCTCMDLGPMVSILVRPIAPSALLYRVQVHNARREYFRRDDRRLSDRFLGVAGLDHGCRGYFDE